MKFVANRYSLNFHIVKEEPLPLPGLTLEKRFFGLPPYELRDVWTVEISTLEDMTQLIQSLEATFELSLSAFWTGDDLENPGQRMHGISVIDDNSHLIDSRDAPVLLKRSKKL
jgi:hypothetical protein